MKDTGQMISDLAAKGAPVAPIPGPGALGMRLGLVLMAYAVAVGYALGLRPDLVLQLHRPLFAGEIMLLAALTASSLWACVHLLFPDQHQRRWILGAPVLFSVALAVLIGTQLFLSADARMVFPSPGQDHGMKCTICIVAVAFLPAALMLLVMRRGASIRPLASGACAVLAAAAIGCLMLRLSESNDSLFHLVTRHYLPTLLFAGLGALAGRIALRW
jgi:hypothetical protein